MSGALAAGRGPRWGRSPGPCAGCHGHQAGAGTGPHQHRLRHVVTAGTGFGYMDTEDHFTLLSVGPDGLGYQIRMSAPGNQQVDEISRRLKWPRHVRREDLEESSRMTLLYSSNDPENYGGQTFAETSRKVLTALKTGGEIPFVFGPDAGIKGDAAASGVLAPAAGKPPPAPQTSGGAPLLPNPAQLFGLLFGLRPALLPRHAAPGRAHRRPGVGARERRARHAARRACRRHIQLQPRGGRKGRGVVAAESRTGRSRCTGKWGRRAAW